MSGPNHHCHAELVSASIFQTAMSVKVAEWTLKQVQVDDLLISLEGSVG